MSGERVPPHRLEPGDRLISETSKLERIVVQGGDKVAVYAMSGRHCAAVWDGKNWRMVTTHGSILKVVEPRWRAELHPDNDTWFVYDGNRKRGENFAYLYDCDTDADLDEVVPKLVDWLNKEYP